MTTPDKGSTTDRGRDDSWATPETNSKQSTAGVFDTIGKTYESLASDLTDRKPRDGTPKRAFRFTLPIALYLLVLIGAVTGLLVDGTGGLIGLLAGAGVAVVLYVLAAVRAVKGRYRLGDPNYQLGFSAVFLGLCGQDYAPLWVCFAAALFGMLLAFAEFVVRPRAVAARHG